MAVFRIADKPGANGRKKDEEDARREERGKTSAEDRTVRPSPGKAWDTPTGGADPTPRNMSRGVGGHSMGGGTRNETAGGARELFRRTIEQQRRSAQAALTVQREQQRQLGQAAQGLYSAYARQQRRTLEADTAVRREQTRQAQNGARSLYRSYADGQRRSAQADLTVQREQQRQLGQAAQGLYSAYARQREAQQNWNAALAAGTAGEALSLAAWPMTREEKYNSFYRLKAESFKVEDPSEDVLLCAAPPTNIVDGLKKYQIRHDQQERETKSFQNALWDLYGVGLRMASARQLEGEELKALYRQQAQAGRQLHDSYLESKKAAAPYDWQGRQELIDEYQALRSLMNPYGVTTQSDADRVDRMMKIRALLESGDIAAGNGLRNYDFRDRAGNVLTGSGKQIGGAFVQAAGELGRNSGKSLVLEQIGNPDQWLMDHRLGLNHDELVLQAREAIDSKEAKQLWQKVYDAATRLSESASKDLIQAKEGLSSLGRIGVDVAETLIEMGIDQATGTIFGNSLVPMFLRTLGSASQEARKNGATEDEEFLYGLTKATIEVATEKLADGVANIYGAGVADEITDRLVHDLAESATGRTFLRILLNSGGEGAEEILSDLLSPLAEAIYRNESLLKLYAELDPAEILYDYFLGVTVGTIGSGMSILSRQDARTSVIPAQQDTLEFQAELEENIRNTGENGEGEKPESETTIEEGEGTKPSERSLHEAVLAKIRASPRLRQMMLEGNTVKINLNSYAEIQNYDIIYRLPNGRTIESTKPIYSPRLKKWIRHGGEVAVRINRENVTWIYTSAEGYRVSYENGLVSFPEEYNHPEYKDINIGSFTGRPSDRMAIERFLFKEFGAEEIPTGYNIHHDVINGSIQLIREEIHKQFTHFGGIYLYTK